MQDPLTTLKYALTAKIEQEAETRDQADRVTRKKINQLEADIKAAFQAINEALDRLETPPTREESPVLARIQETLETLEERITALETSQRHILARLPR